MSAAAPVSRWIAQSLAGLGPGFLLAIALAGLFLQLAPEGSTKVQAAMWLVVPCWLAALAAAFLCRDGLRAWLWLGGGASAAHAALFLCSHAAG